MPLKVCGTPFRTTCSSKERRIFLFSFKCFVAVQGQNKSNVIKDPTEPVCIKASKLKNLDFDLSTGGLQVAPGLETYYVIRSFPTREYLENIIISF